MKYKKTIVTLSITAVLTMLFLTGCKPHHTKGTFALDYISETLDLTELQQNKLETIRTEIVTKMEEMHEDKQEMHASLKEQLGHETIDKDVIRKLVSEHRSRMDEIIDLTIDRLSDFHNDLTQEQREKLLAKLEKFEKSHHGSFHN